MLVSLFHPPHRRPLAETIQHITERIPGLDEADLDFATYENDGAEAIINRLNDGDGVILFTIKSPDLDPTAIALGEMAKARLTPVEKERLYFTDGSEVYTSGGLNVTLAMADDRARY